jgi:type II secretory pathway component PulC
MKTAARPATRRAYLQAFGRLTRCAASLLLSIALCVLVLCLAGCGGSKIEATSTSADVGAAEAPVVETELHRAALDELLARGPAYVLAMVQTDSALSGGRFVGFKIVAFRTELPAYLDLEPGDVVTRVNDLPIERPEQFFTVFEKLKIATEVKFDILRDGAPKTVICPIVP